MHFVCILSTTAVFKKKMKNKHPDYLNTQGSNKPLKHKEMQQWFLIPSPVLRSHCLSFLEVSLPLSGSGGVNTVEAPGPQIAFLAPRSSKAEQSTKSLKGCNSAS